jgi:hypothetical protein
LTIGLNLGKIKIISVYEIHTLIIDGRRIILTDICGLIVTSVACTDMRLVSKYDTDRKR